MRIACSAVPLAAHLDVPPRVSIAYSPELANDDRSNEVVAEHLDEFAAESTVKIRFGAVKVFAEGSIQGLTAGLRWLLYQADHPNGMGLTAPAGLADVLAPYHERGLTIFRHCNGDEVSEAFIHAVEELQRESPHWDHCHAIRHCQMATADQFRRMIGLGISENVFGNHIH